MSRRRHQWLHAMVVDGTGQPRRFSFRPGDVQSIREVRGGAASIMLRKGSAFVPLGGTYADWRQLIVVDDLRRRRQGNDRVTRAAAQLLGGCRAAHRYLEAVQATFISGAGEIPDVEPPLRAVCDAIRAAEGPAVEEPTVEVRL